jgi:hypothetical protein
MDDLNKDRKLQPDQAAMARGVKDRGGKRRGQDVQHKERLDDALERGLEDTFPGSDPVSVIQPPPSLRDKYETQGRYQPECGDGLSL